MKKTKTSKKGKDAQARRMHERIWEGDAPGAQYFPPGAKVPDSAWKRVPAEKPKSTAKGSH